MNNLQNGSSRMPQASGTLEIFGSWLRRSSTSDCESITFKVLIVIDFLNLRESGITNYADIVNYTAPLGDAQEVSKYCFGLTTLA